MALIRLPRPGKVGPGEGGIPNRRTHAPKAAQRRTEDHAPSRSGLGCVLHHSSLAERTPSGQCDEKPPRPFAQGTETSS